MFIECQFNDTIYPGSPTTIFLKVGFRTTIILVGVYLHPKETITFKMVVDFKGKLKDYQTDPHLNCATKKNLRFFPLNPGWIIGILKVAYYNPYITG